MKKLSILGLAAGLALLAAACGGGGGTKTATPAPKATTAPATKAAATTVATKAAEAPTESAEATAGAAPTKAELTADIASLRTIMQAVIAKAQAGDVQGTRDTEGTMDKAMEAVVTALRAVDPNLATTLENLELDIEHQADASNTDLAVIIKDAQAVPAVLDQAATALKVSP
jgi:PBP1b-binding outer membrane lipoprotein LpoB